MSPDSSVNDVNKVGLEHKAQKYWALSQAWNGNTSFSGIKEVGQLIGAVRDLAGACNGRWTLLENIAADLLQRVIQMKRSRKKKPTNNIVVLQDWKLESEKKQSEESKEAQVEAYKQAFWG